MSNFVTLSAIGAKAPDFGSLPKNFASYEKEMKEELKRRLDNVLPDKPDLVAFPECSSLYLPNTKQEIKEYYTYLKDSMLDFLKPVAAQNNTNIAYSAIHYAQPSCDKPFRNSTFYINREGEICGVYHKNHIMEEEYTDMDIKYGTQAKVVGLDFAKAASAICFDLNFDELLYRYQPQNPDLIVFCSMYHGGLMRQAQWAYTCRSYFLGAVAGQQCTILNPYGGVVASSTNYTNYVSAKVNLDFALCHIDYNWEKIKAAKNKYKDGLGVYDPGYVGSVMLSCNITDTTVWDIISEFEITPLDAYLQKAIKHREEHL